MDGPLAPRRGSSRRKRAAWCGARGHLSRGDDPRPREPSRWGGRHRRLAERGATQQAARLASGRPGRGRVAAGGLPGAGGRMSEPRRRLLAWLQRRPAAQAWSLLGPGMLWRVLFLLFPLLIMAVYSVMPRGTYGGVQPGLTLEHYRRFFDPLYLAILRRTVIWSLGCTAVCLLLGYPVAYLVARAGRWRAVLLFLVVLPFWTSFLVRTFAMIFLLRDSGLVNTVLLRLGLIEAPLTLLYTPFAVLLGLVYGFLPFMILPVYASLEKLDPTLLEAAETLGATPLARFRRITLPLSLPGVVAGCFLAFIPAMGSFLTSDLLGGAKELMIGNLPQNQFAAARNWPFGSAASFVVTALVLVAVAAYLRVRDRAADQAE